jgi:phosphomethylpyrimidine synthase
MQISEARKGQLTEEMKAVAAAEGRRPEEIMRGVACGRIVIPRNPRRSIQVRGIGEGLSVKVNANVGTSLDYQNVEEEVEKAKIAVRYGTDSVMDLSTGGDLDAMRRRILDEVKLPVGTVPVYQAVIEGARKSIGEVSSDAFFNAIRRHAADGVDFVTVHCGVTRELVERLRKGGRILGMVSRGGGFLAAWMIERGEENPLYKEFDYLLEIAGEYELTLSLGDGFRPGCLADASDALQLGELLAVAELVKRARERGVQVIVEGPGHMPLDQIEPHIRLAKAVSDGAPLYVLGPLPTDVAAGYDHIAAAIGGALAAMAGADFLCYVTPGEHLCLPSSEDVREGVVAAKIAARAADLARRIGWEGDLGMALARKRLDWAKQIELSVDPERASEYRRRRPPVADPSTCSMCSKFCVLKLIQESLAKRAS